MPRAGRSPCVCVSVSPRQSWGGWEAEASALGKVSRSRKGDLGQGERCWGRAVSPLLAGCWPDPENWKKSRERLGKPLKAEGRVGCCSARTCSPCAASAVAGCAQDEWFSSRKQFLVVICQTQLPELLNKPLLGSFYSSAMVGLDFFLRQSMRKYESASFCNVKVSLLLQYD